MFAFNATAQSSMLEEVVVTAQKKEETLQDAPIAITALTASTIEVGLILATLASFFSSKLAVTVVLIPLELTSSIKCSETSLT